MRLGIAKHSLLRQELEHKGRKSYNCAQLRNVGLDAIFQLEQLMQEFTGHV